MMTEETPLSHGADRRAPSTDAGDATRDGRVRRSTSEELFGGGRLIVIEHAGKEYCLRITRNERLILTA